MIVTATWSNGVQKQFKVTDHSMKDRLETEIKTYCEKHNFELPEYTVEEETDDVHQEI